MVVSSSHGDMESRFGHLIQPIRDLAKNWDVDIATDLEDYLEEIEKISITFDDGQTTMNFAEAALLIQGSACIYSKKVEYLYSMVYQVLDMLASKKKLQQASSVDGEGNDNDAHFQDKKDEDEEFLSLDDIKAPKNIDIKEDALDYDGAPTVPHTPLVLIPLSDVKKDKPLLSKTGEILGNRNDFKLNTSIVHGSTGSMMIDMMHLNLLELSMANKPHSTPYPRYVHGMMGEESEVVVPAMPVMDSCTHDEGAGDVDEGAPMDFSMEDNDGIDLPENEGTELAQPQPDKMELRKKEKKACLKPPPLSTAGTYSHLDPHQMDYVHEKHFKKAKMFRAPPSIEVSTKNNKKRKRNDLMKTKEMTPITQYCITAFHSQADHFPSNPLKAPTFIEFEHLFWKEYRRRQTRLRKERIKLITEGRLRELAEDEQQQHGNEDENMAMAGNNLLDDGDDNDDDAYLVPQVNIPDIEDIGPLQHELERGEISEIQAMNTSRVHGFDEDSIVTSYEDLVRQYVDGFLASAEQYAQTTDLCRRVQQWEEKVLPRLQDEDTHEAFDIHKYGTRILDSVEKNTSAIKEKKSGKTTDNIRIPFAKVVENRPPFDVCRLFLAALQLANNYNVEISSDPKLEERIDTMSLKLLSTKRQFQELLDYQAPSLQH